MVQKHRRNPKERNIEGLRRQLAAEEVRSAQTRVAHESAQRAEARTRAALEALGAEMLPGMAEAETAGPSEDSRIVYVPRPMSEWIDDFVTGPLQDIPQGNSTATIAPAAEFVGVTPSETPIADARAGARERVAVRRAGKTTTICPHGKVEGWCSKPECQEPRKEKTA